ncbi:MAG: hypothetical protein JSW20_12010 [Nitrospiraceae bacterium]|nr:MAG: hypothetical protein JSW20_12010 [Nitrospiraceae bacterium]
MKKMLVILTVGLAMAFTTSVFAENMYDPGVNRRQRLQKKESNRDCRVVS